jgi:hypothetical protein
MGRLGLIKDSRVYSHAPAHHDFKSLPPLPPLRLPPRPLPLRWQEYRDRRAPAQGVAGGLRCHPPARGYDQLAERQFEFIPFLGFLVFLMCSMRRVDCRRCGIVVEEVPWGDGKRTLTRAYMLFLARWARRLSWKETAEAFRTSWEKVFDAVEHVVTYGLEHRVLGQIDAIDVNEIQYAKGHKYLTLVYQIDLGVTRLLWISPHGVVQYSGVTADSLIFVASFFIKTQT